MGQHRSKGLTVQFFDPLWIGSSFLCGYGSAVSAYVHTTKAIGGYHECDIGIEAKRYDQDRWFAEGLGRHCRVLGPAMQPIWEGFVNQVTCNWGNVQRVAGPLFEIANRVAVVYSTIDTSTTPPTVGERATTALANDTVSQARHGIWERYRSESGMTPANAAQIRDTTLRDKAWPARSVRDATGADYTMKIKLFGYVRMMERYIYTRTGVTGTENLSAKLGLLLDADPNGILSSTNAVLTSNTTQVPKEETNSDNAWAVAKRLIALGDSAYRNYNLMCLDDRIVTYSPVQDDSWYTTLAGGRGQFNFRGRGGEFLHDYEVKPGFFMRFPDSFIGEVVVSDDEVRQARSIQFIDQVKYDMARGITISNSKFDLTAQQLARFSLVEST